MTAVVIPVAAIAVAVSGGCAREDGDSPRGSSYVPDGPWIPSELKPRMRDLRPLRRHPGFESSYWTFDELGEDGLIATRCTVGKAQNGASIGPFCYELESIETFDAYQSNPKQEGAMLESLALVPDDVSLVGVMTNDSGSPKRLTAKDGVVQTLTRGQIKKIIPLK